METMPADKNNRLGRAIPVLDEMPRPVFCVGMNGSGTTMLRDSLERHPYIYGYPRETKIIPSLIESQSKFGDLHTDENFRALWT